MLTLKKLMEFIVKKIDYLLSFVQKYYLPISTFILSAILILSLTPADKLPEVAGSDKTHHLIAYIALAFPVALARPKKWLFVILFYFCVSGCIELIQPFVNRYGEWLDLLANGSGLCIGVFIATISRKFFDNYRVGILMLKTDH